MPKIWLILVAILACGNGNAQILLAETLADAWGIALAANAELAASEYEQVAAEWDLQSVRSMRLPGASLRSAYTVRSDTPSFRVDNSILPGFDRFAFAQREAASAQAEVQTPLYTSGRIKHAIQAAQAKLAITGHQAAVTRMDLLLRIGDAYLSVLRNQHEWEVAEQDVATRTAHEKEVQVLFHESRVPRNDLLAAQVTTATAIQHRLRRQHQRQTAGATYNRLLGRPLGTSFTLVELELPWLNHTLDQLEQIAWQQRPDLMKIQSSINARYFESQRLLATRKPQVRVVGRFQYEENRFQDPQSLATAAVVVDWNPFDGGRSKRAAQAELARGASLNRMLEDLRTQVSLELLTIWNMREEAARRRELAVRTLQQADENLRVSRLRYARGLSVHSEVLDAQSRRTQVKKDYYNANYDMAQAQLHLRHAAGIIEQTK